MLVERYKSLSEAVEKLKTCGFEKDFVVRGNHAADADGGQAFAAEDMKIVDQYRFEGPSNPDDMAVVYAVETSSGQRGVIVDSFGTYADQEIGEFVRRIPRDQREFA